MNQSFDRIDWDSDEAVVESNGRPRPTRSRSRQRTQPRRKPKAKRAGVDANQAAKRGIHQRRNRRLSW